MKQTTFLVVIASVLVLGVGASAQTSTRSFSADVTGTVFISDLNDTDPGSAASGHASGVARKGEATGIRPVIGPFTMASAVARGTQPPAPFVGCPAGTIIKVAEQEGSAILTFANSDQLYLELLPTSFTCISFVTTVQINFQSFEYIVVGGTGQYENATGLIVQGNHSSVILFHDADGSPVFGSVTFSLTGEINNIN